MCTARRIAMRIVLAIAPGGLKLAAGAGALLIERTAHPLADFTEQGRAAHGLVLRAAHGDTMRGDQHNLIIGHHTTRRLALTPEK